MFQRAERPGKVQAKTLRTGTGGQGQDLTLGMALLNAVAFDFFNQRGAIQLKQLGGLILNPFCLFKRL